MAMKKFAARFHYQGQHAYKGLIELQADNESIARRLIAIMKECDAPELPQTWDDITFHEID